MNPARRRGNVESSSLGGDVTRLFPKTCGRQTRAGDRPTVWRYRQSVATIEYRCPTHGKVEPVDESAASPVCSLLFSRTIAGKVTVEPCGQPLTAYFE